MKWLRSVDDRQAPPEVIELRSVRDDLKHVTVELQKGQSGYTAALQKLRDEEAKAHG